MGKTLSENQVLFTYNLIRFRKKKFGDRGGPQRLAKALEMSDIQYYQWEGMTHYPTKKNRLKLAACFDIAEDEFFIIPANWEAKKRALLQSKNKLPDDMDSEDEDEGIAPNVSVEQPQPSQEELTASLKKITGIFDYLYDSHVKITKGNIEPEKFLKVLEEVADFIKFKLPKQTGDSGSDKTA